MHQQCETTEQRDEITGIRQRTEVALHIPNDLTVLAKLFAALEVARANILAWCFYSGHDQATTLLVTVNESDTSRVLQQAGFECETTRVVAVGQPRGGIPPGRVSAELRAAGIPVVDAYTCRSRHNSSMLVLKTTDSHRATAMLEAMNLPSSSPPELTNRSQIHYRTTSAVNGAT